MKTDEIWILRCKCLLEAINSLPWQISRLGASIAGHLTRAVWNPIFTKTFSFFLFPCFHEAVATYREWKLTGCCE